MRTLVALLLKKISTPGRLKKLGFGTRLIDDVLRESIEASGRQAAKPAKEGDSEQTVLQVDLSINCQKFYPWLPENSSDQPPNMSFRLTYRSFWTGRSQKTIWLISGLKTSQWTRFWKSLLHKYQDTEES